MEEWGIEVNPADGNDDLAIWKIYIVQSFTEALVKKVRVTYSSKLGENKAFGTR